MTRHAPDRTQLVQERTLVVGDASWCIQVQASLDPPRIGPKTPPPSYRLTLERDDLGPTFAEALARGQALRDQPATLDGVNVLSLHVARAEARFHRNGDEVGAEFELVAVVAEPLPWCRTFDDPSLRTALHAAGEALAPLPIRADSMDVADRYYLFRCWQIGCRGALVDRRDGRVVVMGSAFPEEAWIFALEHDLTNHDKFELIIEELRDPTAWHALARGLGLRGDDELPLVVAVDWRCIGPLYDAGDAVRWSLRPRT